MVILKKWLNYLLSAPRAWVEVDLSAIDNNSNRWTYKDTPRKNIHVPSFIIYMVKVTLRLFAKSTNRLHPCRRAKQLGYMSCLTSAGRVTLVSGTTFLHKNALARLTETNVCVGSVTNILDLGLKAEIGIKEVKINSAKPTVIDWPREIQRKRDICTFDFSIKARESC